MSDNPLMRRAGPWTYSDMSPDQRNRMYDMFRDSYQRETGQSWDRPKFDSRAQNWQFYGDDEGFIAVRPQRSGLKKLVGAAGSPRSVLKGANDLLSEGSPIWGAVSSPLAAAAKKRGFIVPHLHFGGPTLIRMLIRQIPPEVFGGVTPKVLPDGGLELNYPDVGKATKYIVFNKEYLKHLSGFPQVADMIRNNKSVQTFMRLVGGD
jgi:hypothetical protein